MSRAVTADHILFDECISTFRPEKNNHIPLMNNNDSKSFVLTPFELNHDLDLGICVVHSSVKGRLPGAYSAFISTVDNPKWVETHNSHLFGIALSAIISFLTFKPCKSTRDNYLCSYDKLSDSNIHELSIIHPILTAGPGSARPELSAKGQVLIGQELVTLIKLLQTVDYKKYIVVMQSIRLAHLSIINKREDFGLAYLLIVSAIESIAQKAVKRDSVKKVFPSEKVWEEKAKEDDLFSELLKQYKEARGQNQYLKERYVEFILKYAPVNRWEEYVSYPMQDIFDFITCNSPTLSVEYLVEKNSYEIYPNKLEPSEIKEILGDSYKYRSCFVHRGEQPPHTDPEPQLYRFFQEQREFSSDGMKVKLLPNYQLLVGIFKCGIFGWLNKK